MTTVTFKVKIRSDSHKELSDELLQKLPLPKGEFMKGRARFYFDELTGSKLQMDIKGHIDSHFEGDKLDRMLLGLASKLSKWGKRNEAKIDVRFKIQS